ncbi:MAG: hypothetical protein PWP25_197 [Sphaerochaeta sp.]|jgi:hypothetical protein|nr:hypothetical protein [Sphaerochaeta sp.]MDN5333240.1 hypothetical protein [Sphaerochaeta sp.]
MLIPFLSLRWGIKTYINYRILLILPIQKDFMGNFLYPSKNVN